jgi:thioredoxin reductase (NADPH)
MEKIDNTFDTAIIGGGAAGLSAAIYAARALLHTCVIEDVAIGGQVLNIDTLENYPGVYPAQNGFQFIDTLKAQAANFGTTVITGTCGSIVKKGSAFELTLNDGSILAARSIIIATGARPKELFVPGEKELRGRGVSYFATCDGPFFAGKKIFVVGGGDASCDEARFLARISPSQNGRANVVMLVRRDKFRAQKLIASRVLNDANIEVRFNTQIKKIQGVDLLSTIVLVDNTTGSEYTEKGDAVFIFAGLVPQTNFAGVEIQKDADGFIITSEKMESSVKGIFAAGDVRASPFRQVITAVSDGAAAAHVVGEWLEKGIA